MRHPQADFRVVRSDAEAVWIIDMHSQSNPTMSITNDAEAVVAEVLKHYPGRRIVYRDTDEVWDELKHDGSKFTGFGPLTTPLPEELKNA